MMRLPILCTLLAGLSVPFASAQQAAPDPVKIGVHSLFDDLPDDQVPGLIKTFNELVREFTGLNSKVVEGGDAYSVARDLKEGKLHLGVFQGFEFAWVQQKDAKVKPLMIAVYYDRNPRASLVVQKTYANETIADLKGKAVAIPAVSGGHTRLFLDRLTTDQAKTTPKMFFSKVVRPANSEAALDALCDDDVQAVVVDNVSLETYKTVKAGPFRRLKVLKQSDVFPAGVVAYYEGKLDAETLKRFTSGMLEANKSARAKEMMSTFKITAFEVIPADYAQTLAATLKAYPAPEAIAPRDKTGKGN
jgi:ABC-type phosphate/phosphonate transport system substrate-binding protein